MYFAHLFVPLVFYRRYFHSKMKINANLFCILLIYSYLCTRFSENPMHSTTLAVVIKATRRGKNVMATTY